MHRLGSTVGVVKHEDGFVVAQTELLRAAATPARSARCSEDRLEALEGAASLTNRPASFKQLIGPSEVHASQHTGH